MSDQAMEGHAASPLGAEIAAMIAQDGPMSVERYMGLCLSHPVHGYYMTRDPLGAEGDFVTSPEISQMFGELLGLWAAETWRLIGGPQPARLAEIGPGRGTLMADALRAARAAPDFFSELSVTMVETSPALMARQQKISAQRLKRKVGTRQQIIIDETGPTVARGRSKADAPQIDGTIHIASARRLRPGDIVDVRVEAADAYDLSGRAA